MPPLPLVLALLLAALPGAVAAADGGGKGDDRRGRIEEAIASRNAALLPSLREWAARDGDEAVRERAVGALALVGDKGSQKLFLSLLASDRSPRVRRAAADAIGFLALPVSHAPLVEALQKDPSPPVRMEAARAIGRIPGTGGAPALVMALLQDGAPEVRAVAAESIGRLRLAANAESLAWAAERDGSLLVRVYALRALREVSPAAGQATFEAVWTSSKEWDLRLEAYQGLLAGSRRVGWEQEGLADGDDRVRSLALRAWAGRQGFLPTGKEEPRTGTDRIPRTAAEVVLLEKFLSDPARGVRETARHSLEKMGFHVVADGLSYRIDSSR